MLYEQLGGTGQGTGALNAIRIQGTVALNALGAIRRHGTGALIALRAIRRQGKGDSSS